VDQVVGGGDGVAAAGGGLEVAVGEQARGASVGVGVVVFVGDAAGLLDSEKENLAGGELVGACGFVEGDGGEAFVGCEGLGELRGGGGNLEYVGGAVTESDAQAGRENDGEDEDPEDASGSRRKRRKRTRVS